MRMYLDTTSASGYAAGAPGFLGRLQARFGAWIAERRMISQITMELDSHSDSALADMGLSRGDIYAVARGMHRR